MFLKKWLHRTNLNNEICSYGIILMTIFYLQNKNVLPSMKRLQQNINAEKALTVGRKLKIYILFIFIYKIIFILCIEK